MFEKLNTLEARYEEFTKKLSDPEIIANQDQFRYYAKSHAELGEVVEKYREFKKLSQELVDTKDLLHTEHDSEMLELARREVDTLETRLEETEQSLRMLLIPKDPNDEKNIVLEIRAGTGGEEAALFGGDLFRMYAKYAEQRGWKVEVMSQNPIGVGGLKEIIAMIEGKGVYSRLKFESGVHRVQRVPVTEASGRIHTSAVTVAVLPEAEEVEVDLDPQDLRIDVYRSSGPGGQSVNTTDSAVRITHIPTGIVVSCQDEKSQHKNKAKALKILRARLLDKAQHEQQQAIAQNRKSQVGTGDRSERIRTYNFPQSRVTDHRINLTLYALDSILEGDLDEIIDSLITSAKAEALKDIQDE
ncbi:peptide chain release factor 1 [candidate division KSB3 bacterium]|uniref:Peptide chain release factor 1 n=1 Tax=candidate division KSB3 bacterium TaxID=2044937 RepID=A0A9D5JY50_9BACT|nr:peptide chain release factor 1 [candidate division KSB3 bacterium]MBD3326121.1 peptide chain release factor 1 [candidate division KSB3 bacterium]